MWQRRRDFTINSLFYNINTRQVEDFTGRGVEDLLENRLIRTPLPAEDTFMDGAGSSMMQPLRAPSCQNTQCIQLSCTSCRHSPFSPCGVQHGRVLARAAGGAP